MDGTILAWALARPPQDRWRALADALVAGTTRVSFDGRTVEYRSVADLARLLEAGYAAENAAPSRVSMTLATFSRGGAA
jgi:hypothetical protein